MTDKNTLQHCKTISLWLFFCAFTVLIMIIVGAITRLSGSGLSMVEWRPLMGALPPLHEDEWNRVFELYKQSPQFTKVNHWMSLGDFKQIFFWEWFHRLLGRLIGMIYLLPFLFFMAKKWVPTAFVKPLIFLFILGGLQGFMGWYMVKSGLVDIPEVSHYRLAAHLSLALIIISTMIWLGLSFWKYAHQTAAHPDKTLYHHGLACLLALCLTIFWGAYTAGLDAGLVYNDTFPKMGDTWVPEEVWFYEPVWKNFFENHAGVQFVHRWLAMFTALIIVSYVLHAGSKKREDKVFIFLAVMVFAQFSLGLATLFSGVDLVIATSHQGGAVILLGLLLTSLHAVRPTRPLPAH